MRGMPYSRDIVLILAASFLFLCSPMLVTPLITGFAGSVGASAGLMGAIGGLMNLCALLCRPLVGNLADRMSKFRLSSVGAALMAAACGGYIAAPSPAVIVLARVVHGVGYACCTVCMSTWMSNLLTREKIGSGMGFYGMMNALAMAVAPAIGVSVYQSAGYRPAFSIALGFSAATLLAVRFVGDKGEPERRAPGEGERPRGEGPRAVDARVLPVAAIITLFAIPYCATQSFLVSYVQARELPVTVSLFFPLYAAVLLLLRFALKSQFDRLPFRTFLFRSSLCALGAILCLARMEHNGVMFLAAVLMAGGYGIMCSVCQSTAILLAGPERRGLANSTYYIGLDLGMTLGPVIGGLLYGGVDLRLFYPLLLVTVPLSGLVYLLSRKRTAL